MKKTSTKPGATVIAALVFGTLIIFIIGLLLVWKSSLGTIRYSEMPASVVVATNMPDNEPVIEEPVITHISTPSAVRAIYITACTASSKKLRDKALANLDGTALNSIVVDIKDYTGTLAYASTTFRDVSPGKGCIIDDLPEFVRELHEKNIYAIARVTVFQDPLYTSLHPESAIKSISAPEKLWKDIKGLSYIDPGAKKYWDHVIDISKEAYDIGFDEINYDYIRFPSDGNVSDMKLNLAEANELQPASSMGTTTGVVYVSKKAQILSVFFRYLRRGMSDTPVVLSADLFGLTTSASDDLGIGQVLGDALRYFDFVCPMVYPSHFAHGFIGIEKPATKPYEVVKYSMDMAVRKAYAASTSPEKLRPWIQDFDLGAYYTPDMIKAQVKATYDAGLNSWMAWNAGSSYDKAAFIDMPEFVTASTTEGVSAEEGTSTVRISN